MYAVGIDIGSTASKACICDENGNIVAKAIVPIGTGTVGPKQVLENVLEQANITREEILKVLSSVCREAGIRELHFMRRKYYRGW